MLDTRSESAASIKELLKQLLDDGRRWLVAEAKYGHALASSAISQLIWALVFAGLALIVTLTALMALAQTAIAALAIYMGSQVAAGAIVTAVLVVIGIILAWLGYRNAIRAWHELPFVGSSRK